MASTGPFDQRRRSTRVPLKVVVTVESDAERGPCDGEALISTAIGLSVGTRVSIHVYLTDKRAGAQVVYLDPTNPLRCGTELDEARNIWGVSVPPDDWDETSVLGTEH